MSSPFSTFEEFSEAKGPIYTFANNPTMIGFLLVICLAITVYFFYASYTMKQPHRIKPPTAIALLIVTGAASLLGPLATRSPQPPANPPAAQQRQISLKAWPLALLGMIGVGSTPLKGKRLERQRRSRKAQATRRSR